MTSEFRHYISLAADDGTIVEIEITFPAGDASWLETLSEEDRDRHALATLRGFLDEVSPEVDLAATLAATLAAAFKPPAPHDAG